LPKSDLIVDITDVTKVYARGSVHALDFVSLHLKPGEFVSLIGPSGCGKTTLLKTLTGEEDYQSGSVFFQGERIYKNFSWNRAVIYQDIRIFPWMRVNENVYFPLENKGLKKSEAVKVGDEWMDKVGIDKSIRWLYPHELSDGEKQKVSCCRVFALDPAIVLCDEPFSSLDWGTRHALQVELLKYWKEQNKTCIFVTHDIEEAVYLSEKVYCMSARPGRFMEIVDIDIPEDRWTIPRSDPRVVQYTDDITNILIDEIRKAADLDVGIKY
jgi:NitT/TauT family transport system ATP-binding protein